MKYARCAASHFERKNTRKKTERKNEAVPGKTVQKKETAIEIIRFARVNIFNAFPESKEKESERIANKLTKALKKL